MDTNLKRGAPQRRIRVMHVVRNMDTGGMENIVRKLMSALESTRFQQTVCMLVAGAEACPFDTLCLNRNPNRAAFLVPQLARIFAKVRPDVVHSRNWAAIEAVPAAKLAGVPMVIHSEHGRDMQTMVRQPWRRRIFRRLCFSMADRFFCVSNELSAYYCRELGLSRQSLEVIPNGVDLEKFCPDPAARMEFRRKIGAGPDTLVIGAVGRLDPVKDYVNLLRAGQLALQAGLSMRIVIIGDGTARHGLDGYLRANRELSSYVHLPGQIGNVAEWLNSFDVFVLPSLSEGMSNCLLEAMAAGVVPVATNVGGNPEVIVDGESGLLVPPKDPDAICDRLVRLAGAPDLRREIGIKARLRVESRFSLQRMLRRYEQMYSHPVEQDQASCPVASQAS